MKRRVFIKRGALFVPALVGLAKARASIAALIAGSPPAAGASCAYDFCETFEDASTGYVNSNANGWTEYKESPGTGITIDPKSTTTPLAGSQSLRMTSTGIYESYVYKTVSYTDIYVYFLYRGVSSVSTRQILQFTNAGTIAGKVSIRSSGTIDITHGTTNDYNGPAISADTTYHIWVRYKQGSGSNGIMTLEYNTTGTRAGSGANYIGFSNGNGTLSVDAIRLYCKDGTTGMWDNVRVSGSEYPLST